LSNVIENVREDQYDQLREDAECELSLTSNPGNKNGIVTLDDVGELADKKAAEAGEKAWEEYVEKYRADANAAMRKVHEFLGTRSMHVPTSAWTSAKMKPYDEMTEEERNSYY